MGDDATLRTPGSAGLVNSGDRSSPTPLGSGGLLGGALGVPAGAREEGVDGLAERAVSQLLEAMPQLLAVFGPDCSDDVEAIATPAADD